MNDEHQQGIEPLREQGDEAAELAIVTGSPQSYGFPANPTVPESKRWAMQEAFLAKFSKTHLLCASADAAGISPQAVEQWRHGATTNGRDLNAFNSLLPFLNFPSPHFRPWAMRRRNFRWRLQLKITLKELRKYYSEDQIVELTLVICVVNFTNRFNQVLQVEPDPG